jgi:two-component system phosphate regulon sensor histidine kinase PhoR
LQVLYPRVRTRVVTPFLFAIIIIAGVSVFTVTNLVTGSIQERFNNQLIESGKAATNALLETEREILESLRSMVFTVGVPEALAAGDVVSLHALLNPIAANDRVEEVVVFAVSGAGIYRLQRAEDAAGIRYDIVTPVDVYDWRGAVRVLRGERDSIGDKFADLIQRDNSTMLFITAPVVAADANVAAAIVGGIAVGFSTETLARRSEAQALSAVALYDADGEIIGSTFRMGDRSVRGLSPETARERMQQVDSVSPVVELDLEGAPYQILYAPFRVRGETLGILSVGLPSNYIVEQSGVSRNIVALLFGGLFVIVMLVGTWVARSIIHPVTRLVETTRAIMNGDLMRRVGLETRDELGELGDSVDTMTDDLVQRNLQIAELYESQLQVTAQREAVFANISDAVMVQDGAGNIIQLNVAAYRLMDAVSRHPGQRRQLDLLLKRTNQGAFGEEQLIELAGGYYNVKDSPVRLPGGELIGYVTTFTDLSAIIRAERLKDELLLQMSHELRTPLAALRGNIDLIRLLEKARLSEKGAGFLQKSTDQLSILERLLNQVVDVSSIITNKFYLDKRPIDIVPLLQQTAEGWKERFRERGLTLEIVAPNGQICIDADSERLQQVFDHILRNAYSYTLQGGARVRVDSHENAARLIVIDTGVGIEADEIEHVFERMYRGSASHAGPTDSRGMGLGLYLARHIVELHQGDIRLESVAGQGTRVTIMLPLVSEAVVRA